MRERPIPFSAPMVRAILAGGKTQTRRAMRRQFCWDAEPEEMCATNERGHQTSGHSGLWWDATRGDPDAAARCPYGKPGDRLWVRETFARIDGQTQPWIETDYRATYKHGDRLGDTLSIKKRWTPAIHMPRHASRITLEVTGVRVERLQDISEADAIAEGVERGEGFPGWYRGPLPGDSAGLEQAGREFKIPTAFPHLAYRALWESINGPGSWDANPWVWVVEFRRMTPTNSADPHGQSPGSAGWSHGHRG